MASRLACGHLCAELEIDRALSAGGGGCQRDDPEHHQVDRFARCEYAAFDLLPCSYIAPHLAAQTSERCFQTN